MNQHTPTTTRLNQPLNDLAAWTRYFLNAEIPVLAQTANALEVLRAKQENVDANSLGEAIAGDPLMTLKLLAYVSASRSSRVVTDAETVIGALVMVGISPFFANFGPQPVIEHQLADIPEALEGLQRTLQRAHRSATFALEFAVHRLDHDAAVIHTATLLHDFAEMLLWCHAPELALTIGSAQSVNPSLRSSIAQKSILNIELADLQQSLMKAWRLPELLIRINDDRHVDHPAVRIVTLATRLARHSALGWNNPAIPDDIDEIADLLNLSHLATLHLVQD